MTVMGALSSFPEPGEMSPHKRASVDRTDQLGNYCPRALGRVVGPRVEGASNVDRREGASDLKTSFPPSGLLVRFVSMVAASCARERFGERGEVGEVTDVARALLRGL
jgi:hypothetical protein